MHNTNNPSQPPQLNTASSQNSVSHAEHQKVVATAKGYLTLNLFLWPGVGTLRAKDKKNGWFQVKLSLWGLALMLFSIAATIATIFWMDHIASSSVRPHPIYVIGLVVIDILLCVAGLLIFIWSWLISIFWGLRHIKEIKERLKK